MNTKKIVSTLALASVLLLANAAFANAAGPGGTDPLPKPGSAATTAGSVSQIITVIQTILGL
jgi:hypothetical protein